MLLQFWGWGLAFLCKYWTPWWKGGLCWRLWWWLFHDERGYYVQDYDDDDLMINRMKIFMMMDITVIVIFDIKIWLHFWPAHEFLEKVVMIVFDIVVNGNKWCLIMFNNDVGRAWKTSDLWSSAFICRFTPWWRMMMTMIWWGGGGKYDDYDDNYGRVIKRTHFSTYFYF